MSKYHPQPYEDDVDEYPSNRPVLPKYATPKQIQEARERANQRGKRRVTTEDFDQYVVEKYTAETIPMNQIDPEEENWHRRYNDPYRSSRTQRPAQRPMQPVRPVDPERTQRPVRIDTEPQRGDKLIRRRSFIQTGMRYVKAAGIGAGTAALIVGFTVVRSELLTRIKNRWDQGVTHATTAKVFDSQGQPVAVFHAFVEDGILYTLEVRGTSKKSTYAHYSDLNYDGDSAQIEIDIQIESPTVLRVHAGVGNIDVWGNQGHADVEFRFQPKEGCFIPLPQSK